MDVLIIPGLASQVWVEWRDHLARGQGWEYQEVQHGASAVGYTSHMTGSGPRLERTVRPVIRYRMEVLLREVVLSGGNARV